MAAIDSLPIAVVMQRRKVSHPWADEAWAAVAVMRDEACAPGITPLSSDAERQSWLVSGLALELYGDDNESYHENWLAPSPKVCVGWRMVDGQAVPLRASVRCVDGTRMFDSGEPADGVMMPPDIHAWLGNYLRQHYTPPEPGGERRHGKRARS
jgi:hypothetical protein